MIKELWHEKRGGLAFVAYEEGSGIETIEASALFHMRANISLLELERTVLSRQDLEKHLQKKILAEFLASMEKMIPEIREAIRELEAF